MTMRVSNAHIDAKMHSQPHFYCEPPSIDKACRALNTQLAALLSYRLPTLYHSFDAINPITHRDILTCLIGTPAQ